jgi:hypothetical protein
MQLEAEIRERKITWGKFFLVFFWDRMIRPLFEVATEKMLLAVFFSEVYRECDL